MTRASVLPDSPEVFLTYCGMETDLIFNRGIELPGFASFPLLENEPGRQLIADYLKRSIALGQRTGTGVILESATWMANRDRARSLGYAPEQLAEINRVAISLMADISDEAQGGPILLSANIGPRSDAYVPDAKMSISEAETYHSEQINALAETEVHLISGYTLADQIEAAGIARAAQAIGKPCIISFTVETDGRLPNGVKLEEAIAFVDRETDAFPAHYMINCAHPDHFERILDDGAWMHRLGGLVPNASRCSHAELDEAEELDDGDPEELAATLADMRSRYPQLRVLGGCCGTDMRHMRKIAEAVTVQ